MALFALFGWRGLLWQSVCQCFWGEKGEVLRAEKEVGMGEGFSDEVFSEADMHVGEGGGDGRRGW